METFEMIYNYQKEIAIKRIKRELDAISISYNEEDVADFYDYYMELGYAVEEAVEKTIDEIMGE